MRFKIHIPSNNQTEEYMDLAIPFLTGYVKHNASPKQVES